MYEDVCRMTSGTVEYSKQGWKQLIWDRAWQIEKGAWSDGSSLFAISPLISKKIKTETYFVRWQLLLSDMEFGISSDLCQLWLIRD